MKFSNRVVFLFGFLALNALAGNDPNNRCKLADEFRNLNSPSSAHAIQYSCRPRYDGVSFRELSPFIARQDREKEYRFPKSDFGPDIVAYIREEGKKVRICRDEKQGNGQECSDFPAQRLLHYAQSKNYCGRDADTENKVEMIDTKDPKLTLPQGALIPNPPEAFGGVENEKFKAYDLACFQDDIVSDKKNAKKRANDLKEKHDAFVSGCKQAIDAFWVSFEERFAADCAEYATQKALDQQAKLDQDARKNAKDEDDKLRQSKQKDLEDQKRLDQLNNEKKPEGDSPKGEKKSGQI